MPCSEPKMFPDPDRYPQFPDRCILPDEVAAKKARRLGEASTNDVTRDVAERACAHHPQDSQEACIYDAMALGDLEYAGKLKY